MITARPEKKLIVICGPTASGKTSMAIEVALHYKTEIISADSRQFYREMNVGTAKPSEQQLKKVKHHFINSHSIFDEVNTGVYESECIPLLDQLFLSHDILVMVGGTGLYINAVINGLDNLPEADPTIRSSLQKKLEEKGIESLQAQLLELDPASYHKTDLQNPNRLMRALEVCLATGSPYSSFLSKKQTQRNFKPCLFGIDMERETLYAGINKRVDDMMQNGLLKEAKELYPHKNLNALQTVGYTELFDLIENKTTLAEAVEKIKQHTRNYAKRQVTWFKKVPGITWIKTTKEIYNSLN